MQAAAQLLTSTWPASKQNGSAAGSNMDKQCMKLSAASSTAARQHNKVLSCYQHTARQHCSHLHTELVAQGPWSSGISAGDRDGPSLQQGESPVCNGCIR